MGKETDRGRERDNKQQSRTGTRNEFPLPTFKSRQCQMEFEVEFPGTAFNLHLAPVYDQQQTRPSCQQIECGFDMYIYICRYIYVYILKYEYNMRNFRLRIKLQQFRNHQAAPFAAGPGPEIHHRHRARRATVKLVESNWERKRERKPSTSLYCVWASCCRLLVNMLPQL